jgi:hypothetical protein
MRCLTYEIAEVRRQGTAYNASVFEDSPRQAEEPESSISVRLGRLRVGKALQGGVAADRLESGTRDALKQVRPIFRGNVKMNAKLG